MFQSFETHGDPGKGPARLEALRHQMRRENLDGFIVPRADAHQGEYIADADKRLEWLCGFTGSAGFCIALTDVAGVFIDGRYRNQVRGQVDLGAFTPVHWPETQPGPWLAEHMPKGGRVGFDAWLHNVAEIEKIQKDLLGEGVDLVSGTNLIDQIWPDRPIPPHGKITPQPVEFTGKSHDGKRADLAAILTESAHVASVLTLSDSIAWLLNVRGDDIPHIPVSL